MNKFNRWIRSKQGTTAILGLVVVALIVALIVQQSDLFGAGGKKKITPQPTETLASVITEEPNQTVPELQAPATYPDPIGGFSCLPTCAVDDAKFLVMVGEKMSSLSGQKQVFWVGVPGNQTGFTLGIFDGDSGKDNTGALNKSGGNFDSVTTQSTYTLFADPLKDGTGQTVLVTWYGNDSGMPNNDWFEQTLNNDPAALAPSGHFYYRLEVTQPVDGIGLNSFKLRSTGYLSLGRFQASKSVLGFVGAIINVNDARIVNPGYQSVKNPGNTNYLGNWDFYFYVPNKATSIELWNGDFDRGTSVNLDEDTDDPNTEGMPEWANAFTVPEGQRGQGMPADDNINVPFHIRAPAVNIQLLDPLGEPIYLDENPSGTEEWERWMVSTDPTENPDQVATEIKPGFYTLHIEGLDSYNSVWIKSDYDICDQEDGCGPPVWDEGFCPRTIGYWKNNVKKVLIEGRTNGVQETPDSIHKALGYIAMASHLYVNGINVAAPVAITDNSTPLTDQEADAILQKAAGNTMLDRALQQNLASWLNLATGKIGPTAWVVINTPSGTYEGTMMGALEAAEDMILSGTNLEFAKDIADMINNGQINVDPPENIDPNTGAAVCTIYEQAVPPAKQPPTHDKMPKAPKPKDPPPPVIEPPADPETCTGRANTYGVENPTNNPFYGIKFEYQSGTEVKNGDFDLFNVTLPADVVAAMTAVPVEAKAGELAGQATIEACDFTSPLPCGEPVRDPDGYFAFYFMGAVDNGDGTYTLTFQVQNMTEHGLSHATIGLPDGAVPTQSGSYNAKVCDQ